ncbi:hypothetical protein D0809_15400 [Flavobacterium circumlabens]|uniref:Uncharacterized protein n=1 Tax=Flavobacterium circumlabens TaxID=2133765 RepID=A0A4Y7UAU4_9FLAO|nr:hypothetical protein [Flavobacterium circumlabens]TEB43540.1 hypothetical protein D0809_15400 [Flavobacterium circumlabens]
MTKKAFILFVFLAIGFFLTPISGYACENHTGKSAHKKEISANEKEKDCCTKDCCRKTASPKKEKHDCDGKCNHTNCTTSSLQFSIPALNDFELPNILFNFSIEKPVSYHNEARISDGFTSIWLPPKI